MHANKALCAMVLADTLCRISIAAYRLLFHRLRSFQGPILASLSNFWRSHLHLDGEYHRKIQQLHREYGDFLRVAPRELDINNVEAIKVIYGPLSKCRKGPWYSGLASSGKTRSVQSTVDPRAHRWRRNIWAQGNSVAVINEFQPLLIKHVDLFLERLRNSPGSVDIGQLFTFLSFDVMGDLM